MVPVPYSYCSVYSCPPHPPSPPPLPEVQGLDNPPESEEHTILRLIDGDTIEVENLGTVCCASVNTSEAKRLSEMQTLQTSSEKLTTAPTERLTTRRGNSYWYRTDWEHTAQSRPAIVGQYFHRRLVYVLAGRIQSSAEYAKGTHSVQKGVHVPCIQKP